MLDETAVRLDDIIAAVKKCGDIILFVNDAERSMVTKAGKANFVTKYDMAIQEALKDEFEKILPQAQFVAEEGDCSKGAGQGYAFIVDPIDGTTNFIKNYKKSCVSAGLARDGQMVLAVVYNPFTGEMYSAQKGGGAFLNGKQIHVSSHPLSEELVAVGTSPYNEELIDDTFDLAKTLHRASYDIRRSGAAALDLCDIAEGRCGLFFELQLSPWDYAAGSLIVTEAGGKVSRMDGSPLTFDKGGSVLAGNPRAYEDYFKLPGHLERK